MLGLYRRFGDVVYFDYHQSLPEGTFEGDGGSTRLAVFVGMGVSAELLIFAVCLLQDAQEEDLSWLIEQFVEIVGRPPTSLFTDGDEQLSASIDRLTERGVLTGVRLVDPYYTLERRDIKLSRRVRELLGEAIRSPNEFQFRSHLRPGIAQDCPFNEL